MWPLFGYSRNSVAFAAAAFGHGVGNAAGKVGEQSVQVIFECAGDALDPRELPKKHC